jgi:SAM-dependent methyltransferase
LPPGNTTRLVQQIAPIVTKSVQQIVPLADRNEAVESYVDAVWQSLAEDPELSVQVQRLYLLAPGDTVPVSDATGDFDIQSVAVRDFVAAQTVPLPVRSLWLIDGTAVLSEDPESPGYWQVSTRPVDVDRFRAVWEPLWNRRASEPYELSTLSEPLAESADMMAKLAGMSCDKRLYVDGTCAWYHSIWQYLRLFDLVSSPAWHAEFFSQALKEEFCRPYGTEEPGRRPRVLITGTADYSMLAYVLRSAESAGTGVGVTVMDQCRTPLIACQWYARGRQLPNEVTSDQVSLDVWERDIFTLFSNEADPLAEGQFDVITTDAFLTRFEFSKAAEVARTWYRLLRPGGSVITTARIHPLDAPRGGILDEVSSFAMRARDCATRWRPYVRVKLEDITIGARQYAMQMRSYDLGDAASIHDLLTEAGFTIEAQEIGKVSGELRPASYLRLIARKPKA